MCIATGTIANLVTTANAQASRIAAEKKTIDDFLLARRVPGPLAKRVRGYANKLTIYFAEGPHIICIYIALRIQMSIIHLRYSG